MPKLASPRVVDRHDITVLQSPNDTITLFISLLNSRVGSERVSKADERFIRIPEGFEGRCGFRLNEEVQAVVDRDNVMLVLAVWRLIYLGPDRRPRTQKGSYLCEKTHLPALCPASEGTCREPDSAGEFAPPQEAGL